MKILGMGPWELALILAIILLLFGPKQIPKLSRMFGKAVKDVREGLEGKDEETPAAPIAEATSAPVDNAEKKESESVSS